MELKHDYAARLSRKKSIVVSAANNQEEHPMNKNPDCDEGR